MVGNKKLVSDDTEGANYLNNFFSVIKNLEIPKFGVKEIFHKKIESPTLKAVLKYRIHPSIIFILYSFHQASSFNFPCINKNTVLKKLGA